MGRAMNVGLSETYSNVGSIAFSNTSRKLNVSFSGCLSLPHQGEDTAYPEYDSKHRE